MKKIILIASLLMASFGYVYAEQHEGEQITDQTICIVKGTSKETKRRSGLPLYEKCQKGDIIYWEATVSRMSMRDTVLTEFVRTYCSYEHQIHSVHQAPPASHLSVSCVYRGSPRDKKTIP